MQFYGFYVWNKNMNPKTNEVYKRSLSMRDTMILLAVVFGMTIAYGIILQILNGNLPFVDALGTVISVIALIISIKMYTEQWLLWIIVNVINVFLWIQAFISGSGTVAILAMCIIYLINSILMYFKWNNEAMAS